MKYEQLKYWVSSKSTAMEMLIFCNNFQFQSGSGARGSSTNDIEGLKTRLQSLQEEIVALKKE